ncbi:hypothetical protein DFH06DRAFT_1168648 [Mycena polygramma]|nr:hypothetical protein DFH06DRAFT_1168648 [Mycena polygramma]
MLPSLRLLYLCFSVSWDLSNLCAPAQVLPPAIKTRPDLIQSSMSSGMLAHPSLLWWPLVLCIFQSPPPLLLSTGFLMTPHA